MNIQSFRKILVANRGEIAIRVFRAASELNLRTVAIYTYEDRYSQHRFKADESYQIGEDHEPLKPYLDIEKIISLAKKKQVDAIHPGYGFLSENVQFARRCREEGIVFVGPSPEVMERLGDKMAAKILAKKVGVPLIEDAHANPEMPDEVILQAEKIGFPVIVKAAAGGGGRGMRVVHRSKDLPNELKEASGEAKTAFGDGTVFIEKFIEDPKHLEVQILGDKYGNIVHLYERDCSVQRRFQKVVEIAPSLTLTDTTKERLYAYALALTREVGYSHAGTVEFLVDQDEEIYFIEVNPRIQVEHTVTEEVTGIDIVRAQFLIAMGYPLSHSEIRLASQSDVTISGYAVQCRITTERPSEDFKPDYGTLIEYRSASGMGIRLDAGSAYPGARISPFFDSLLVKVTAWGRTLPGATQRMHRALREFRIRGVNTNIGFLLNLLRDPVFTSGSATVNFIKNNPALLVPPKWQDRATKLLRYVAEVIVNKNDDVPFQDSKRIFLPIHIQSIDRDLPKPKGSRDLKNELGRAKFLKWIKEQQQILYTDTTFRDAHQSLLATRVRTYDMLAIADHYAYGCAESLFSMEVWGGATFDVSMRFLKECPWERLKVLREHIPNILFQMLLRGSNAVGYTAYPDNLIEKFIVKAADSGIDLFRIFDSLNWVEAMKTSIKTVINETDALAEVSICYTGDITDTHKAKYNLQYYLDLARRLEDEGAHILAIKDMAGLLKPLAAEMLIFELKEILSIPIHLHTHDTASVQAATYLKAIDAGVDIIDCAIGPMSGLTSQPNWNSVAEMTFGHPRYRPYQKEILNELSNYWESVRTLYYPFETELRAGTADVYDHEIPGGQYSNLRPQARSLGLEGQFELIKKNYKEANKLFGDIIKVTPSSKVVGDMALFMTANQLTVSDILEKGHQLSFPDSVKSLMRGDLGQSPGGFPAHIQRIVLKDEIPFTDLPNVHLCPINFDEALYTLKKEFGDDMNWEDLLSYLMYPNVFSAYRKHVDIYGDVSKLPTAAFFYGLKPNEEINVAMDEGKYVLIKYLNKTAPDEHGIRMVTFALNGQYRSIPVKDKGADMPAIIREKVKHESDIGSPLQGSLSKILVKPGDPIEINTPLFVIEAMKMESTVTSPMKGRIAEVVLKPGTLVEQDDLIVRIEK
jgi:pyruvate carboxylase